MQKVIAYNAISPDKFLIKKMQLRDEDCCKSIKTKNFPISGKIVKALTYSLKNDQKLLAIAQNGKTIHFLAKRNKLT